MSYEMNEMKRPSMRYPSDRSPVFEAKTPGPTFETSENVPTELERYWKSVNENPSDFTGWTYLLQYVEQENLLEDARKAFDAFFLRYPYCYGYWKKYADLEKVDVAQQVFERAVKAIPLSIDLWLHYVEYVIATSRTLSSDEADRRIESCFERAVDAAGMEFRSDKLWETYIGWLKEHSSLKKVLSVVDRVLKIPTQKYRCYFEILKDLVNQHHPKHLLSIEEFLSMRKQVVLQTQTPSETPDDHEGDNMSLDKVNDDDRPPGVDDSPPSDELLAVKESSKFDVEEETSLLQKKIVETREVWHRKNEEEIAKRWNFEEGIRRPYFHVKPLERTQLKNWKEYLEFEIANGTRVQVVCLFERCLIACALYEEFWLKYAKYMESNNVEEARLILRRACRTHLPRKPSVHLAWAAFEERHGCPDIAMDILGELEANLPGLAMVAVRRIGVERRRGNREAATALFSRLIAEADSAEVRSFYTIKYSRYQAKVLGNIGLAKQILEDELAKNSTNSKLYLQLLDLEYQQPVINESAMSALFERAIKADLAIEHRVAFSQRRMEFLEDFGSDVTRIIQAYDEHQKLMKDFRLVRKQRMATDSAGDEAHAAKRGKLDVAALSNGSASVTVVHGGSHLPHPSDSTTGVISHSAMMPPAPLPYSYTHNHPWPGYAGAMYDYHPTAWTGGYSAAPYYGAPSH